MAGPPTLEMLFGPILIGAILNFILYGVLLVQMLIYYQGYRRDASWIRYFILYLFIVETLNTGFNVGMLYEPFAQKYGTVEAVTFFPIMLGTDPVVTAAVSTPIQIFIAWRIKLVSQSIWIPMVICVTAIASLAGGIWTTYVIATIRVFSRKPEGNKPGLLWLIASAVSDVLITVTLVTSLYKRKTGLKKSDDLVNRVIRMTVQTGMITAVFALLDIAFFLGSPGSALNFIWSFALSKLYSNALLSSLNARAGWRDMSTINEPGEHNVLFGEDPSTLRGGSSLTAGSTSYNVPRLSGRSGYDAEAFPQKDFALEGRKQVHVMDDHIHSPAQ